MFARRVGVRPVVAASSALAKSHVPVVQKWLALPHAQAKKTPKPSERGGKVWSPPTPKCQMKMMAKDNTASVSPSVGAKAEGNDESKRLDAAMRVLNADAASPMSQVKSQRKLVLETRGYLKDHKTEAAYASFKQLMAKYEVSRALWHDMLMYLATTKKVAEMMEVFRGIHAARPPISMTPELYTRVMLTLAKQRSYDDMYTVFLALTQDTNVRPTIEFYNVMITELSNVSQHAKFLEAVVDDLRFRQILPNADTINVELARRSKNRANLAALFRAILQQDVAPNETSYDILVPSFTPPHNTEELNVLKELLRDAEKRSEFVPSHQKHPEARYPDLRPPLVLNEKCFRCFIESFASANETHFMMTAYTMMRAQRILPDRPTVDQLLGALGRGVSERGDDACLGYMIQVQSDMAQNHMQVTSA